MMVCLSFWADSYMFIYTHCWELMKSVGSHGSLLLLFMMKVMVTDSFVSNCIDYTHSHVTFKLLWRFLCNFKDIYVGTNCCSSEGPKSKQMFCST